MNLYKDKILPLFIATGKSNAQLEKEIGLPRSIIYDWNKERTQSYKKYIDQIAKYFGTSVEELLSDSDTIIFKDFTNSGNMVAKVTAPVTFTTASTEDSSVSTRFRDAQEEELLRIFRTFGPRLRHKAMSLLYELEEDSAN